MPCVLWGSFRKLTFLALAAPSTNRASVPMLRGTAVEAGRRRWRSLIRFVQTPPCSVLTHAILTIAQPAGQHGRAVIPETRTRGASIPLLVIPHTYIHTCLCCWVREKIQGPKQNRSVIISSLSAAMMMGLLLHLFFYICQSSLTIGFTTAKYSCFVRLGTRQYMSSHVCSHSCRFYIVGR